LGISSATQTPPTANAAEETFARAANPDDGDFSKAAREKRVDLSASSGKPKNSSPLKQGPRSRHLHWLLVLALLPLAVSIFQGPSDIPERLMRSLESAPGLGEQMEQQTFDSLTSLLMAMPGHAIEGALLARDSWAHWLFALASAGLFTLLITRLFDLGGASLRQLLLTGLFTATIGVLLLLMFQAAATYTQGFVVHGRGVLVLLFYVVKFIGFSYRAALDPSNGFVLSLVGFTFGVGFCEEVTKALPLMFYVKEMRTIGWRGALTWGLASGAGFGIAEGIFVFLRPLQRYAHKWRLFCAIHLLRRVARDLDGDQRARHLSQPRCARRLGGDSRYGRGFPADCARADGSARPLRHAVEARFGSLRVVDRGRQFSAAGLADRAGLRARRLFA
jgi:hypothetical protein